MAGKKPIKSPRHPVAGIAAVILLGLLAAFFAWQGAQPLWLALGRGETGTATVARCDPTDGGPVTLAEAPGATYSCVTFEADTGSFRAADVTLLGAGEAARTEGTQLPARMLSPEREQAYAADSAGLHLRWAIGLVLVLACGGGTVWASGATRLDRPRSRRIAVLVSFAGPLLLAAGVVVAAY